MAAAGAGAQLQPRRAAVWLALARPPVAHAAVNTEEKLSRRYLRQRVVERLLQDAPGLPADPVEVGGSHLVYGLAVIEENRTDYPITVLTYLTAEEEAGFIARGKDRTVFFWSVLECVGLLEPVCVDDGAARRATVFKIMDHSLARLRDRVGDAGAGMLQRRLVDRFPSSGLSLPKCMLTLLLHGSWRTVALSSSCTFRTNADLHSWRRKPPVHEDLPVGEDAPPVPEPAVPFGQGGFNPNDAIDVAVDLGEEGVQAAAQAERLDDALRDLMNQVRCWKAMLLDGTAFDQEEERTQFEQALHTLDQFKGELGFDAVRGHALRSTKGTCAFAMQHLVKVVLLSARVRTVDHIRKVLCDAIAVIFPRSMAVVFRRMIQSPRYRVPSAATVSHARFCFDMALALCQRDLFKQWLGDANAEKPLLLGMTDSSPVGRHNWQNTSFAVVLAADLVNVGRAAARLATLRRDDDLVQTDDEQEAIKTMKAGIAEFMCTCAALGSKRAGLPHKLHAILHQCFVITGTPPLLQSFCSSIAAWTTDLGVESSISQAPPMPFDRIFPYFCRPAEDGEVQEGYWETQIDLRNALPIGGGLHFASNMMKGMLAAMPQWTESLGEQASALARFLHQPWTRERFVQTCLVGELRRFSFLFESFPADLTRWRWGDVQKVVSRMLELERPLRLAWDVARLNFGEGQNAAGNPANPNGVNLAMCTEAINSDYFWSFLAMVDILAGVGNHLQSWLQSCPCHRGEALEDLHRRFGPCPNSGRNMARLAAGELDRFAEEMLLLAHGDVLQVTQGLTAQEVMRLLDSFELARQHMLMHVRIKGAHHADIPLLLAVLCHPFPQVARSGARRALLKWDGMDAAQRQRAHRVSRLFLQEGPGTHRNALMQFSLTEDPLSDFPEMERDVYRISLAKIDEHAAEGPHALMKKELHRASNASAALLSLSARLPLWEWLLARNPEQLLALAEFMDQIYNTDKASYVLGVENHPDMITALLRNCIVTEEGVQSWLDRGRCNAKVLKRIVYHVDNFSRYRAAEHMDAAGPDPPPAPPAPAPGVPPGADMAAGAPDQPDAAGPPGDPHGADAAAALPDQPEAAGPPGAHHGVHAAVGASGAAPPGIPPQRAGAAAAAPHLGASAASLQLGAAEASARGSADMAPNAPVPASVSETAVRSATLSFFKDKLAAWEETETGSECAAPFWLSVNKSNSGFRSPRPVMDLWAQRPQRPRRLCYKQASLTPRASDHDVEFEDEGGCVLVEQGGKREAPVPAPEAQCPHAFFRVNVANPQSWKRLVGDAGAGAGLSDVMAMQRHYAVSLPTGGSLQVCLAPASAYDSEGRSDTLLQLRDVDLSRAVRWQVDESRPVFTMTDVELDDDFDAADVQDAVKKLVEASAWPGSCRYFIAEGVSPACAKAFSALSQQLLAAPSPDRGTPAWQFTQTGLDRLSVSVTLQSPTPFLAVDAAKPAEEWSVFELMTSLKQKGWTHWVWTDTRRDQRPPPFELRSSGPDSTRFWTKPTDKALQRNYLLLLWLASTKTEAAEALEAHNMKVIHHLRGSQHYSDLLRMLTPSKADEIEFEDPDQPGVSKDSQAMTRRRHHAFRLEHSFRWGLISFKFRGATKKQPCEGFQVDCPRKSHIVRRGAKSRTVCSKTLRFLPGDREDTIRRLKYWAAKCNCYNSKQAHQRWTPVLAECPGDAELEGMRTDERDDTDDEPLQAVLKARGQKRKLDTSALADDRSADEAGTPASSSSSSSQATPGDSSSSNGNASDSDSSSSD